jgi:hypothetical protein
LNIHLTNKTDLFDIRINKASTCRQPKRAIRAANLAV